MQSQNVCRMTSLILHLDGAIASTTWLPEYSRSVPFNNQIVHVLMWSSFEPMTDLLLLEPSKGQTGIGDIDMHTELSQRGAEHRAAAHARKSKMRQ